MSDWQAGALCAKTDSETFFPNKGESPLQAKAICRGCPVRLACLTYALDNDERFGVWGGFSWQERRRITVDTAQDAINLDDPNRGRRDYWREHKRRKRAKDAA